MKMATLLEEAYAGIEHLPVKKRLLVGRSVENGQYIWQAGSVDDYDSLVPEIDCGAILSDFVAGEQDSVIAYASDEDDSTIVVVAGAGSVRYVKKLLKLAADQIKQGDPGEPTTSRVLH